MTYHDITIENTGETYRCLVQESLLASMERLGKKGIPVGCRGGGCGICLVQVKTGQFEKRAMSREFVSETDESNGRVLACRVRPVSNMCIEVLGGMRKNLSRSRQSD